MPRRRSDILASSSVAPALGIWSLVFLWSLELGIWSFLWYSTAHDMNLPPNREVAFFSAALELPAGQRAAYLDEACADDPTLRLRLEALLRVHEQAIPFLETPPLRADESPMRAEVLNATVRLSGSPAEKAGDRIGRYKLLQQIGEGGCGVVYMAEQAQPVRRRVALKIIKLGMDTKQVIAWFAALKSPIIVTKTIFPPPSGSICSFKFVAQFNMRTKRASSIGISSRRIS